MSTRTFSIYEFKNAEIIKENQNTFLSLIGEIYYNDTVTTIKIPKILLSDDTITIKCNDDIFATDCNIEFKVKSEGIIFEEKVRELTKEQIEKELGYKIKII